MNTEIFKIQTEDGVFLDGYRTVNNSKKVVISTHGMTSNCFKTRDEVFKTKLAEINVDYIAYNNRGSELVKFVDKKQDDVSEKITCGTAYEDVLDGYYDIKAVINYAKSLGYEDIYLQGHSLGCTKTILTYNKLSQERINMIGSIKGVILLSLVNIKEFFNLDYVEVAKTIKEDRFMPESAFIHPISAKSYLRYTVDNEEIDFARYDDESYDFDKLNNIKCPLFMRWGNNGEMINQDASYIVDLINNKITNNHKDIGYIDGANHGYTGYEEILANQIVEFIKGI